MHFPAPPSGEFLRPVFVCQFIKSLPLLRKIEPSRFDFDEPSVGRHIQALFRVSGYSVAYSENMASSSDVRRECLRCYLG
jgi:hypothetical protein